MMKKGFTLIELLIVIGIISILVTMEAFVLLGSQQSARDSKRKADLENIRAAVEQYRSDNNSYPASLTFNPNCTPNGSFLPSPGNIYMNPLPSDPRCQSYFYYYSSLPPGCAGTSLNVCNDYTLGTFLEKTPPSTCKVSGTQCQKGSGACNYCLGPYGTK